MKIIVNTRLLIDNKLEGIGWFSYETLKRITVNHPEHEFIFVFDREFSDKFIFADNITPIVGFPPAKHPYLWYMFFEWCIPYYMKKFKADMLLSTDGWIPLRHDIKSVDVIHDLNFEIYPNFVKESHLGYMRKNFPRFANKASRIATVSEYSKFDLNRLYGVPKNKIDVVYNGAGDCYFPIPDEEKQLIKNKYTGGNDFFVYVGALNKRKNLPGIFKAFDRFRDNCVSEIKLVIVGNKMDWKGEIEDAYNAMKYKNEVVFTKWIDSVELNKVLASAIALTYVSFFEGFGIPIVEAFKAGVPVITSNTTSMPEVAGDAALIVNPNSVDAIYEGLKTMAFDKTRREDFIQKGFERKHMFTWDKTAENLWNTIETVLLQ